MSTAHRIVAAIAVAVALALAFAWPRVPAPVGAAPTTEFSAERAVEQLRRIAGRPHPTGTSANDEVRETIAAQLWALGYTVQVQDTTSLTEVYAARFGMPVVAAHVRNVIARRAGTTPGPALLLMAHYDSRELAPGASDDGYGAVALLETARALAASQQLRHDVVLLFTEGEENGLMGARAFFAESPAARDIGLVLNFEARGNSGPVVMFQTSEGAAGLVDVMASAAPDVFASSLSQEVYRRMPNDSDLTVAIAAGFPSMNFANVDGFERYHQSTDTVPNASAATVQHHGSYALALARAFGDAEPMVPPTRGDEVYFDLGPIFVHYGARLALPLAIGVAVIAGLALVAGRRRRPLRVGRIVGAAGVATIAPVVAAAVAAGVGWLAMHAGGPDLAMQTARDGVKAVYDGAMAALGVAVAWAVLSAARARGVRHGEMAAGSLVVMILLAVASAILLPGGSFLFVWPAAAMAIAAMWPVVPAQALAATVALMTVVPLARLLGVIFGAPIAPAIAGIAALATAATFPLLEIVAGSRRWSPALVVGVASLAAVATALEWPAFDEATPRPDSLLYVLDADHDSATWRSTDPAPDVWTSSVLSGATRTPASDVFPRWKRQLLSAPAPLVDVRKPEVDVISDEREGDSRTLRLHIGVPTGTESLLLSVPPAAHVATASVEGRRFSAEPEDGWLDLVYFGPPPWGLDVTFTAPAAAPIPVHLVAQLRGFPARVAPRSPRPPGLMPAVSWNTLYASDMTLVTMSYTH
jgi:hypothetical protein